MFVKKIRSKNFTYVSLVESYREHGMVKHRTIAKLGRLDDLRQRDQINKIAQSLSHLGGGKPISVLNDIEELERANWGAEKIIRALWNKFDLNNLFEEISQNSNIQYDLSECVFLEVLSRLVEPVSKLELYNTQNKFHGIKNVRLENLYRALDVLSTHKDGIEVFLFNKNKTLFNMSVDVVFYDVTTLYFESVKSDLLKEFGYSKDCKFGEVQVVLGLLIDNEGRPVGFDVYPGNTFEGNTLETALNKLKYRFKINKIIIVADRGINSKLNLKKVKDAGFDYIVGSRLKTTASKVREMVLDSNNYDTLHDADECKIAYKILDFDNHIKYQDDLGKFHNHILKEKLICTWSKKRELKDQKDRQRLLEKAQEMVDKKSNILNKRGAKKYLKTQDNLKAYCLDEEKIFQDRQWDGYYGIQTSKLDLSAATALDAYHNLWRIEESFRILKSTLEARPMFHWTSKRIKGHLVICFIAFLLERSLELILHKKKNSMSPKKIRKAISSLQFSRLNIQGKEYHLRSPIEHDAGAILKALKLKAPKSLSEPTTS